MSTVSILSGKENIFQNLGFGQPNSVFQERAEFQRSWLLKELRLIFKKTKILGAKCYIIGTALRAFKGQWQGRHFAYFCPRL